jgi:hypothetical protein
MRRGSSLNKIPALTRLDIQSFVSFEIFKRNAHLIYLDVQKKRQTERALIEEYKDTVKRIASLH